MLCFPHSIYYSRVTIPEVASILEADRLAEVYLPTVQAAEYYLRQQTGLTSLDAFCFLASIQEAGQIEIVRLPS